MASRGLDIPAIKTVINFDVARRAEDHTHRIGRTGRAGATDGTAYTLVTHGEADAAVDLVRSLRSAAQAPPPDLIELAQRSRRWAASGLAEPKVVAQHNPAAPPPPPPPGAAGGGGAVSQCAPPQVYQMEKLKAAAPGDPVAMAKLVAARLSAQGAAGLQAQFAPPPGCGGSAAPRAAAPFAPPPPPPAAGNPYPPPPPAGGPHAAAAAAAQAVAARLSASLTGRVPPPPPPPPPR